MRHIPEDELHAYLDQGLSRSQCVEIESHLAACSSCRANRDGIAALRDRTTALLARLAPPRRLPPPIDDLRALAAQRVSSRRRRIRSGAWAASLVGALGLGWIASTVVGPGAAPTIATRSSPPVTVAPAARPDSGTSVVKPEAVASRPVPKTAATPLAVRPEAPTAPAPSRTRRQAREDSIRAAKLAVLDPSPALELTPLQSPAPGAARQFGGMWRTMSWDGAQSAGEDVPHIDGLPVLAVEVQANNQGKRPLMVVAQQLSSGQVIQTIEGPAADVSQLLSRRSATSPDSKLSVLISDAEPAADQTMAMQRGDRMIAITGALPSDSLRAMIRRINAEMRSK